MLRLLSALLVGILVAISNDAAAQEPRWVAAADVGLPTTWDDEGLLGRGAATQH